ncbi:MAG: glycoside hydrolase family 3 N-terminal domain-containing protein, partial [Schleiferiaceae bacterium]|nr:glycoside hydrolase family 3 N-terminal domain-containing protein [Schleiferiaceae bacterium]
MLRYMLLTLILLFTFFISTPIQADNDLNYNSETSLSLIVKSMPLEKLCGQMIMVSGYSNLGDNHFSMLKKLVRKGQIGGLIWMQGSPNKQRNMIRELQDVSQKNNGINLLMAQDAEWGAAMRLDSLDRLPWPLTLGATRNNKLANEYGKSLGAESNYLGINVNFSPV